MEHVIFQRVEQLRRAHNLDVPQMCVILKIEVEQYPKLAERPMEILSIDSLQRLHQSLNASADYLLFGSEPMLIEYNSNQVPGTRMELDEIKLHIQKLRDQIRPTQSEVG